MPRGLKLISTPRPPCGFSSGSSAVGVSSALRSLSRRDGEWECEDVVKDGGERLLGDDICATW